MGKTCDPTRGGLPNVYWIYVLFGDCVYGSQEATSVLLGYTSILCWFNAQLPQIYENYKNGSVESLSLPFLANWMLGDITNLLGCILTKQLPFQTYLAVYFCIVDMILMCQWVFYTYMRPRPSPPSLEPYESNDEGLPLIVEPERNTYTFPRDKTGEAHKRSTSMIFFALLLFTFNEIQSPQLTTTSSLESLSLGDGLESLGPSSKTVGRIMAWTCTVFYLTSRMPQIWKNWKRGSVEGLSIALFIFAASGNLTYTLSIFTNPARGSTKEALPYILGSAGTLMFDVTIYIQWWYYTSSHKHVRRRGYEHLLEEADGHSAVAMEVSRPSSDVEEEEAEEES